MTDENYMKQAILQARQASEKGNWPIGCVIVLDGKIIAAKHNLVYSTENRLAHAEVLALEEAKTEIFANPRQATLYTTFEPCPMCFGASLNSRLKRVVYGIDANDSGAVHLKNYLPKLYDNGEYETEFVGGVLAEECKKVYDDGEAEVSRTRQAIEDEATEREKQ